MHKKKNQIIENWNFDKEFQGTSKVEIILI